MVPAPSFKSAAFGLCLASVLVWTTSAGARPQRASAPTVVRGGGVDRPAPVSGPPRSPRALSRAAKTSLAAKAGIATTLSKAPAQVSARTPHVAARMMLMLVEPGLVNPEANYVEFPAKGVNAPTEHVGSFAGLWVKSPSAGAKILVDCAVRIEAKPGESKSVLKVRFEDGTHLKKRVHDGAHPHLMDPRQPRREVAFVSDLLLVALESPHV